MDTLCLTNEARIYKGDKIVSSISGAGKTGQLCIKEEKAMATHSSTLAWKMPWTEEPGRLPSMGSLRVGHD